MSKTSPSTPRRKKGFLFWLKRLVIAGALLTLLLFLGSNLFLRSSIGQRSIEKNLNRRTLGLIWQIESASWSPWNGVSVQNLTANFSTPETEQLPPLLILEEITLKPYWREILQGKKLFREVTLEQPHLRFPAEFLITTAPPAAPPSQPSPTPQAKEDPTPTPKSATTPGKPKPQPARPKPAPKPPPAHAPQEIIEKQFRVCIVDAKIDLYSLKLQKSFLIEGLDLDLPLAGPTSNGSLSWEQLSLAGLPLTSKQHLPVEWKDLTWTLPNQDIPIQLPSLTDPTVTPLPLEIRLGGELSPSRRGKPFRLNLSLSPQAIPDYLLHKDARFHLRAQRCAAALSSNGSLLNPNTWRMQSNWSLDGIEAFSDLRQKHFHFDTARAQVNLRQGILSAPQISLRSEDFSLMGNGQLSLSGYLLAVHRIVSAPELAERLDSIAIGSFLSQGWTSYWMRPLDTPDRYYRDIHFEGLLPHAQVNTGRRAEFIPLSQALALLKKFTNREAAEELQPNHLEQP